MPRARPSASPWNDGTLDVFIADLLEAKLRLIRAVEADVAPNASVLDEFYEKLRSLGPALLQENKALQATGEIRDRSSKRSPRPTFPKRRTRLSLRQVSTNSKALVIPAWCTG